MGAKIKTFLAIFLISLVPTLLIWLPFILRLDSFWTIPLPKEGMATIAANFDGPLYIVVAKSLYKAKIIENFPFSLPNEYYAAHLPLYPLLIRLFAPISGYLYSMLFVTLVSSVFACIFFFKLARQHLDKTNAIYLTTLFALLPARFLVVRSVGSPEPLFLGLILSSVFFYKQKRYWLAGLFGGLAAMTKSPGILLFIAYCLDILLEGYKNLATLDLSKWFSQKKIVNKLPLLLIPVSLLAVFLLYQLQMNDFLAYFHSGDNIHLFLPPFQIFNFSADWVGTFWLEDVIFVYLLGLIGVVKLSQEKQYLYAWFAGLYLLSIFFVAHRDVVRYALPMTPFILLGFSNTLIKKEYKIALVFIIIPIFLYSIAFISQNTMAISDWSQLL